MNAVFYISAVVAVVATARVVTCRNPVHAILYLIVSLLAVAVVFFVLGAPLIAALEVIIYAGAIMMLFVFVVMMLDLSPHKAGRESRWPDLRGWIGPAALGLVLLGELAYVVAHIPARLPPGPVVGPERVGLTLFSTYRLAVELASVLLLAGLVGAYHLVRAPGGPESRKT